MADHNNAEKHHKSFRFSSDTLQKLKDLADLFGMSETAMMKQIVDNYHTNRLERFEEDRKARVERAK